MHKTIAQKQIHRQKKSASSPLMTPSIPASPRLPSNVAWNVSGSETPAFSNRHKTSGQIFLQNWLQTQAEVDTPQRCNEHRPWNNELTPGNPPVPIRRLSFPSLTPPGVSFSVGSSSVPSTSSHSIEIARRNLSSQIPGDFEGDLSGELNCGDEGNVTADFNDFSCIAQALKDNTFSALSSFDSRDMFFDESESLGFGHLPFLSAKHAQLDEDLKGKTGARRSPPPESRYLDAPSDQESCYGSPEDENSLGACSCDSDGPTPVTTFPRDTHEPENGVHNTTDMALEMLSIIASLDTITINKLHRLFSIAGQGDMTVAVERLQKHVRPRNDLPSLFAGASTIQSVYSQPAESVMVTEVTPLIKASAQVSEESKNSTWQRVKRRVSHSCKI